MRFALSVMVLSLPVLASDWLAAQDAPAKPAASQRIFRGAGDCLKCHFGGLPKGGEVDPALAAFGFEGGGTDDSWVLADEVKTYIGKDRHSQSFTALKNDRSKRMGKLLGVEEIHRDKRCLACHTGFPLAAMGDDPQLISEDLLDRTKAGPAGVLKVEQGVNCEGCHSPSGDAVVNPEANKGWFVPHVTKEKWRFLSAKDKLEKYGFTDIRSPSARTRMCLSCHLGNVAEGKVVTHEMYAAGHPPLPGFEMETFAYQMPKHWRDFHEKTPTVREEFLKKSEDDVYGRDTYKLDNLHQTNVVLVSALVAFSENLKLGANLADTAAAMPVAKPDFPELAQYECFACHHDLKDRSWRQRRALSGAPGRPLLRSWPTVLTKLALKRLSGSSEEFDRRMKSVDKLLSDQPFGRREEWVAAVKPVTEWIDQQARELERKPLSRTEGVQLLRDTVAVADSNLWDYDSARQLVWVTQVLRRELGADPSPPAIKNLVATVNDELADVEKLFALNLMDGQDEEQPIPGQPEKKRKVKVIDLTKTLAPISRYDAFEFQNKFKAVAGKLPAAN
jgi:cytochrome c553